MKKPLTAVLTACLLCLLPCQKATAQQVAVKANALSWALATPDIGLEVITGEHTSVAMSVFGHYRPYGFNSKMAVLQPEFRYWFSGRPLTREYIGVIALGAFYDTLLAGQYYKGNAIALGISGGYIFNLGKRWGLELSGGTGVLVFSQKHYWEGDQYDQYFFGENTRPNSWGYKLFPLKLAVTFIYIIR